MYKIEKNEKEKGYFIEEIGHAMENRPDLYCKAYMSLQDRYQEEGRVLFFELAKTDLETLQLLLCFIITEDECYAEDRHNELENS
jgi:hypothetical protein